MPLLCDQQHKLIFQTALVRLLRRQDLVDWNLLHTTLCGTTELETQVIQQRGAIDAVTRMVDDAITAYTTHLQDQYTYQQHFAQLETQRLEAVDELTAPEAEITCRQRLHADLTTYRNALTGL
jgi:site-specific recombinase